MTVPAFVDCHSHVVPSGDDGAQNDAEPKTLEEIGRRLGLTRERVRQIELESLRRLATLREMQVVAG